GRGGRARRGPDRACSGWSLLRPVAVARNGSFKPSSSGSSDTGGPDDESTPAPDNDTEAGRTWCAGAATPTSTREARLFSWQNRRPVRLGDHASPRELPASQQPQRRRNPRAGNPGRTHALSQEPQLTPPCGSGPSLKHAAPAGTSTC